MDHKDHDNEYEQTENTKELGLFSTVYPLFTGMELVNLDVKGAHYYPKINESKNAMEINYCLSGRAELTMEDGCLQYIGQGDIFISALPNHSSSIEIPLGYYSAIVLTIDLDMIDIASVSTVLGNKVDFEKIIEKLFENDRCFLLRARESTINFFTGTQSIANHQLKSYYRLKAMEILLFLENINPKLEKPVKAYNRSQVDIVKRAEKYMTTHLEQRLTIENLAQEFCISPTTLKLLFKEIFGKPIITYMRDYRIQRAKSLLIETDYNIFEISNQVGYESQSKFGVVFRNMTGLTPTEYRDKHQYHDTH